MTNKSSALLAPAGDDAHCRFRFTPYLLYISFSNKLIVRSVHLFLTLTYLLAYLLAVLIRGGIWSRLEELLASNDT